MQVGTAPPGFSWDDVLGHRAAGDRARLGERLGAHGAGSADVAQVLGDRGFRLATAAASGEAGWSECFGGPLGAALLADEVAGAAGEAKSRATTARSVAVRDLLEEFSAVAVAGQLGVSRQAVYEIARGGPLAALAAKPKVAAPVSAAMVEVVALPAGDSLLHPLDIGPARRRWLPAWLARRNSVVAAAVAAGGLWWLVPGISAMTALAAGAAVWAAARAGAWLLFREAWAFVPRRRAAMLRPAPTAWTIANSVAVNAAGVAVVLEVLDQFPAPQFRAFTFGMLAVAGVLGGFRSGWRAGRRRSWRPLVLSGPSLAAVAVLAFVVAARLPAMLSADVVTGAATATVESALLIGVPAVFGSSGGRARRRRGAAPWWSPDAVAG